MGNEVKLVGGVLLLFSGFYVLIRGGDYGVFAGLLLGAVGLWLILSNFK